MFYTGFDAFFSILFPLVFLYVSGAMKNIDNSLLEAAESMGCKGIKRFLTVIVPLCMPTILAAMLLVFMRAFADFGTPLLIGQGYRTFRWRSTTPSSRRPPAVTTALPAPPR